MFSDMVTILPEGKDADAAIEHFSVSADDAAMTALGGGRSYVPPGRYCRLVRGQTTVMSDTRYERLTNMEVVRRAQGDVLIAGLGIGMIVLPILRKPEVTQVVIVEQSAAVIRLVLPTLQQQAGSEKLCVVEGDIWSWRPLIDAKYHTIYFDIWADQSTDALEDMTRLHRAFRKYLVRGGWMASWNREYLRDQKRRGR